MDLFFSNLIYIDFQNTEWIVLYIILGVLCFLLIIFLIAYPFIKKKYEFRNFQKTYYKKIRKVADIKDFYLINNLILKNNDQILCKIDHILFGDKYIYVIKDRYYRGAVSGGKKDSTWLFFDHQGLKQEMNNPMMVNLERIDKLAMLTQIDRSFFISIVLINDNCVIKNVKDLNSDDSFVISVSKFAKLIKLIEDRDVKKINSTQLQYAVEDIAKLYGKGSSKDNTNE